MTLRCISLTFVPLVSGGEQKLYMKNWLESEEQRAKEKEKIPTLQKKRLNV